MWARSSLLEQYGCLIVLFGVMLECTGVPIPDETILIACGIMAHQGHLDLGDAVAFGVLGTVLGEQIRYRVGGIGGCPFVLR